MRAVPFDWMPTATPEPESRAPEPFPALTFEAVPRARPGVRVPVVDGRDDGAVRRDDRRGLEIVGSDALALHAEDGGRHVAEAAVVERPGDVERTQPFDEHAVGRDHVGSS